MRRDLLKAFAAVFTFALILFIGPTLYAQAVSALQGGGEAATSTAVSGIEEGWAVLIWGFLSTTGLEWIKRKPWLNAILSEQTTWKAQRIIGVLVACASALGIHFAFDATTGTLTITGLVVGSILEFGKDVLRQFIVQEMSYKVMYRGPDRPAVDALVAARTPVQL